MLGLSCVTSIGAKNQGKAILAALLGLLISTVGLDPINGIERFTFKKSFLMNGIDFIPVIIGSFALAEVYNNLENADRREDGLVDQKVSLEILRFKDMLKMWATFIRSSVIGTIIGIIPAAGGSIASLVSYGIAVRSDKEPERFGKGAFEGVIAPESANNAAVGGAMVPTLVLGIPGSPTTAVIMTVFLLHGLRPGPLLLREQPILLYSIFIGIIIASALLFLLGRYIAREFARVLKLPYPLLATLIIVLGTVGAYSLKNSYYDVLIMLIFSVVGYLFNKFHYSTASFVLGLILGGLAENSLRQQLIINDGSWMGFITRPISCIVIVLAVGAFLSPLLGAWREKIKRSKTISA